MEGGTLGQSKVMNAVADFETILNQPEQELWAEYQNLRKEFLKSKALTVLERFITNLQNYPEETRSKWVFAFCYALFDKGLIETRDKISILQYPLATRIILPELRKGYEAKKLPYARWIAQMRGKFPLHQPKYLEILDLSEYDYDSLLEKALELDPQDSIAREIMIKRYVDSFNYYIHEVPIGILADSNEFKKEIARFIELVTQQGTLENYRKKLVGWQLHAEWWGDYLARRPEFKNYTEYLTAKFPDMSKNLYRLSKADNVYDLLKSEENV